MGDLAVGGSNGNGHGASGGVCLIDGGQRRDSSGGACRAGGSATEGTMTCDLQL